MNSLHAMWLRVLIWMANSNIQIAQTQIDNARASIAEDREIRDRLSLQLYALEQDQPC